MHIVATFFIHALLLAPSAWGFSPLRAQKPPGRIDRLRLIDADTNMVVVGYDPIPINNNNTAIIDIRALPIYNLNIEAITTNGTVGHMKFEVDGMSVNSESSGPWSFCKNNGNDFFPCPQLQNGFNGTIKATPYSSSSPSAIVGTAFSINLQLSMRVRSTFNLINTDTNMEIGALTNDTMIDLTATPRLKVRAEFPYSVQSRIGSVKFTRNGVEEVVVASPPYIFPANSSDLYFPFIEDRTLEVTAYKLSNARGSVLFSAMVYLQPFDNVDPKILSVDALSALTVDVSAGPGTVSLQIQAQDTGTGIDKGNVSIYDSNGDFYTKVTQYDITSYDKSTDSYFMKMDIPFEQYIPSGTYSLALGIVDGGKRYIELNRTQLAGLGYPNSINVISQQDRSPPKLLNLMALSSTKVNVTRGSANVVLQIEVQDDEKGFYEGYVATYLGEKQTSYHYFYAHIPVANQPIQFNASLEIPQFASPGNHTIRVFLNDATYGNNITISSNELAARGLPSTIAVVGAVNDVQPPTLVQFVALSPTNLLLSEENDATVQFRIAVQDNFSGFDVGYIEAVHANGTSTYVTFSARQRRKGTKSMMFDVTLPFDKTMPGGKYALSVYLMDFAGNESSFGAGLVPREIDVVVKKEPVY